MQLDINEVDRIIDLGLIEDLGQGDITSLATIDEDVVCEFVIATRQDIVVCGVDVAKRVFANAAGDVDIKSQCKNGDRLKKGDVILKGSGNARQVMAAERLSLNIIALMSAVATTTDMFVKKTVGTNAKILDTRKTIPGLRSLQKYAVLAGGGMNHRFGLDDGVLIKDNHISVCGSVSNALRKAKASFSDKKIEIECDTIQQVQEALDSGADIILLDNMSLDDLRQAVELTNGKVPLEASGGVDINTVEEIAKTGVDYISVGKITQWPVSVDIGLDIFL